MGCVTATSSQPYAARSESQFRCCLGLALAQAGQFVSASECLQRALSLSHQSGDRLNESLALCALAEVEHARGERDSDSGKLGLALRSLTPNEQEQLGTKGRLVVEDASGPALAAGVQPGDVVLGINGTPVSSVSELKREVGRASGSIALLI